MTSIATDATQDGLEHPLNLLLNAKAKADIDWFFQAVFRHRHDLSCLDYARVKEIGGVANDGDARNLAAAAQVWCRGASTNARGRLTRALCKSAVAPVWTIDFKASLRKSSLRKTMLEWKAIASQQVLSWPRLELDMDWRVDVKTCSDSVNQMAVPSVILGMQIEDQPERRSASPKVKNVTFELNKEELKTMLAGMEQIAKQLGAMSKMSPSLCMGDVHADDGDGLR